MDDQTDSNPFISVYTPVALVALALSALFFSQIKGTSGAVESMKWQSSNADKQITSLRENTLKIDEVIKKQETDVATSVDTQKQFSEFIKEVNELALKGEKDKDAKDAIIVMNKAVEVGIRYAGPPEAAKKDDAPKKDDKKEEKKTP